MTVTFENKGWLRTQHQAVLLNNLEVLAMTSVVLERKKSELVTFDLSGLTSGPHNLTIGGQTFPLTLYRPASFTLTELQVTPHTLMIGEKALVQLTIFNSGEVAGLYDEVLYYNGDPVASITCAVTPGQTAVVEAELVIEEKGWHQITVAGRSQDIRVLEPASITLSELRLSEKQIAPDEPFTAEAILINSGDVVGTHTVEFLVNGVIQEEKTVTLSAGQTKAVPFIFSAATPGIYVIQIGDISESAQIVLLTRPRNGTLLDTKANSGSSSVALINHEKSQDAVFILTARQEPEQPLLVVYVHSDSKTNHIRVKDGTYIVYCTTGQDFDAASGRFMTDPRYYRFDHTISLTTSKSGSTVSYSVWTVSIGRENGNTPAKAVHEHVFPRLDS